MQIGRDPPHWVGCGGRRKPLVVTNPALLRGLLALVALGEPRKHQTVSLQATSEIREAGDHPDRGLTAGL